MARTYNVMKRHDDPVSDFTLVAAIEASSGDQAIRLAAVELGSGRYIAVPSSNWTEVGVRVEIPAPRVIFENEQNSAPVLDSDLDTSEAPAEGAGPGAEEPPQEETLVDDEQFQERKAELAARRAGQ